MKIVVVFETTHGNESKIMKALINADIYNKSDKSFTQESVFIINNDQQGDPTENNDALDYLILLANEERIKF